VRALRAISSDIPACCVAAAILLLFVVPFADVVRDFGTRPDALVATVISISQGLRANADTALAGMAATLGTALVAFRFPRLRKRLLAPLLKLPLVRSVVVLRRTTVFCRSLGTLLSNGVHLTDALRLMVETGVSEGQLAEVSDRVRQSANANDTPGAASRQMLRVGEESGARGEPLRRLLRSENKNPKRWPAAIVLISIVIATLIISIMSTLLSINQLAL
jgi:general secretion pathway protein F